MAQHTQFRLITHEYKSKQKLIRGKLVSSSAVKVPVFSHEEPVTQHDNQRSAHA